VAGDWYPPNQGPLYPCQYAALLTRLKTKTFSAGDVMVARYPPAALAAALASSHERVPGMDTTS
jgi:hypothetical protein